MVKTRYLGNGLGSDIGWLDPIKVPQGHGISLDDIPSPSKLFDMLFLCLVFNHIYHSAILRIRCAPFELRCTL